MFTQEYTPAQMFSIDLAQLQNRYFLVHLPAVDSASVSFSKTSSIVSYNDTMIVITVLKN